jgi:hypothetical protein
MSYFHPTPFAQGERLRVGKVKRIRGKKLPLTAAGVHALRDEYTRTIEPARALAAETLTLERTLSDLVKGSTHSLDSAEEPLWSKSDGEKHHLRCIPRQFKSRTDEASA